MITQKEFNNAKEIMSHGYQGIKGREKDTDYPGYKTLRQLKDYDRVELCQDATDLQPELDKFNPIYTGKTPELHPLLPEFVLKLKDRVSHKGLNVVTTTFVYLNEPANIIEVYLFESTTGVFYMPFAMLADGSMHITGKISEQECHMVLAQVISVLGYIQHKMAEEQTVVKTERLGRTVRANKPTANTNQEKLSQRRTVKVLNGDKVIYTVTANNKDIAGGLRKYQRRAGSWSVTGHPRKLKSGEVTWVKPYTKGTGAMTPKTYIIK